MPKSISHLSEEKHEKYIQLCKEEPLKTITNRAQRAEYLHFVHHFERWELLALNETTPKSWRLMLVAHATKRSAGVPGRPRLLTEEDEKKIVSTALDADAKNFALFIKDIGDLVFLFSFVTFTVYFSLGYTIGYHFRQEDW